VGISLMDLDEQYEVNHLFLTERKCRKCGVTKDLIDGFYRTRKNKYELASSYSYECKECTINRVKTSKKNKRKNPDWEYPDW
jgi:hypothetical protein